MTHDDIGDVGDVTARWNLTADSQVTDRVRTGASRVVFVQSSGGRRLPF